MISNISTTTVVPVREQGEEADELVLRLKPAKLLKLFVAVRTVDEGEGGDTLTNAYDMLTYAMIDKMAERPDLDIIIQKFSKSDYIPARNMGALIIDTLAGQPGKWAKAVKLCKTFARDTDPGVLKTLEESMEFMSYGLKASFSERMDVYQLIFKVQSRTASMSSDESD